MATSDASNQATARAAALMANRNCSAMSATVPAASMSPATRRQNVDMRKNVMRRRASAKCAGTVSVQLARARCCVLA